MNKKYDIFISYSRKDFAVADRIEIELKRNNITAFLDRSDINYGDDYAAIIARSIHDCQIFLFIWSENSNNSEETANEIAIAILYEKTILPFKIGTFEPDFRLVGRLARLNRVDASVLNESLILDLVQKISGMLGQREKGKEEDLDMKSKGEKPQDTMCLKIKTDADCAIYVDDERVADSDGGKIVRVNLKKGIYSLKFVSKLYEYAVVDKLYKVESTDMDDMLNIEIKALTMLSLPDEKLALFKNYEDKFGFKYNGRVVIDPIYDEAKSFSDNLVAVKRNNRWGYVDKRSQEVIPFRFLSAWSFSEGLAMVKFENGLGFYIDKSGREIVQIKHPAANRFSEGLAAVKSHSGKYGYIDVRGEEIIPLIYDNAWSFVEGMAMVRLDQKYGYINKLGDVIIPIQYDNAWAFSEGVARVELNSKLGFIDKSGRIVIDLKYDDAESFSDGLARVLYNGKYGVIDKLGKTVVAFHHEDDDDWDEEISK